MHMLNLFLSGIEARESADHAPWLRIASGSCRNDIGDTMCYEISTYGAINFSSLQLFYGNLQNRLGAQRGHPAR